MFLYLTQLRRIYFLTVAVCLFVSSVLAHDKKTASYNIFYSAPGTELRNMETDRQDMTESPIDAGHFQYEGDLSHLQRERNENSLKNTYLLNQANLKLGLTGSSFTAKLCSFKEVSDEDGSVYLSHRFGDLTLHIKQNLIGNDNGSFAIALLPYIKFPTSATEKGERYEGGIPAYVL